MAGSRRARLRERAAPTMRVAGAILLAAGMIHLYADLVVFDARAFGARAALSLGDPRVAGFVAERITDEVVAQKRDLMAYRPLLVGTTRAIVGSEPFRAGFRRAAQSAHATLFSESAERLALSVPDLGVLVRSASPTTPRSPAASPPACAAASWSSRRDTWRARSWASPSSATGSAATRSWRSARASCSSSWASPCPPTGGRRSSRRGGPRLRRPRPLLPAPARPHRPHRLDAERGAAAGGGGSVGRIRGWPPAVGARSRRHRYRPRVRGVVVREPRRDRGDRTACLEPAAGAGADVAGRDPPGRSPHRARAPGRVPPDRDPPGPDGDRRRPPRLRGPAGAVHARAPAPPGGSESRGGGPRRGAREGGARGGRADARALRRRRPAGGGA